MSDAFRAAAAQIEILATARARIAAFCERSISRVRKTPTSLVLVLPTSFSLAHAPSKLPARRVDFVPFTKPRLHLNAFKL